MEIPYLRLWPSFLHRHRAAAQETSKALVFAGSGDDWLQSSVSFHPGQNPSYLNHLEIVFKTPAPMVPFHSGSDSCRDCSKAVRECLTILCSPPWTGSCCSCYTREFPVRSRDTSPYQVLIRSSRRAGGGGCTTIGYCKNSHRTDVGCTNSP